MMRILRGLAYLVGILVAAALIVSHWDNTRMRKLADEQTKKAWKRQDELTRQNIELQDKILECRMRVSQKQATPVLTSKICRLLCANLASKERPQ